MKTVHWLQIRSTVHNQRGPLLFLQVTSGSVEHRECGETHRRPWPIYISPRLRLTQTVMKTLLCTSALYRCCSVYFSSNVCLMCRLIYAPSFSITSAFPTVTDLRCFHSHCILHNLLINSFSNRNKSICLQKTRSPAIAEGPRDAGVPVEIW